MASVVAGCGGSTHAPETLLDGTAPATLPRELSPLEGRVAMTRVRVVSAASLGVLGRRCFERFAPLRPRPSQQVVERVGFTGASLTFHLGPAPRLYGCDRTAGPTGGGGHWCASSVGTTRAGRLLDPRVSIVCTDGHGDPVGFGWIDPHRKARWVVAGAEVYPVVRGQSVRVTTHDVELEGSSATFDVVQYDTSGREVARQVLRAAVAG